MSTTTRSADFSSTAVRLHLLEKKVEAATPPDLTALIAGVNRLYEMTMRGSQYTSGASPLVYDQEAGTFWYDDPTHGTIGTETGKSLFNTVLGTQDNVSKAAAGGSFWQQTFGSGSTHWAEFEDGSYTLAHAVFKTPSDMTTFLASGTVLDQLNSALARIASLEEKQALHGW